MKTIQLRVQDEFVDELLQMLPRDKVKVMDKGFFDNQNKLHKELESFLNATTEFIPYHEDMKETDSWIKKGQE